MDFPSFPCVRAGKSRHAPHPHAATGTGAWSRRLRTHAALPMPTGLSAECASVDARAGWVHLASRRVTRARTHLGDQAHSQHRVDRSTQEVRVQGITDHSARMPTLRNACSVCAISAAKASWLSLRRSSWVLDTVPPTHPLSDVWSGDGQLNRGSHCLPAAFRCPSEQIASRLLGLCHVGCCPATP